MTMTDPTQIPRPDAWEVRIPYLKVVVGAVSLNTGRLPGFLGSTLRGALGHALLALGAPGTVLFDEIFTPTPVQDSFHGRQTAVAPAFVIDVPMEYPAKWFPGDKLRFGMILMGPALARFSEMLAALPLLLERGLGVDRQRVFFQIDALLLDGAAGPVPLGSSYTPGRSLESFLSEAANELLVTPGVPERGEARLRCLTPLQVRSAKKVLRNMSFLDLVRALKMRLEAVAGFGTTRGERRADVLFRLAEDVAHRSEFYFAPLKRYSNRQGHSVELHAILGELRACGQLGVFLPLLRMGELLHVGHGSSQGMGALRIVWMPEE